MGDGGCTGLYFYCTCISSLLDCCLTANCGWRQLLLALGMSKCSGDSHTFVCLQSSPHSTVSGALIKTSLLLDVFHVLLRCSSTLPWYRVCGGFRVFVFEVFKWVDPVKPELEQSSKPWHSPRGAFSSDGMGCPLPLACFCPPPTFQGRPVQGVVARSGGCE